MFWNADTFMRLVANFRLVWLSGRFGGGKTAGSLWMAIWLMRNGFADKVVSNIDITGRVFPPPVPLKDAAMIVDEAWMYLDTWQNVKEYAAFLRKANLFLIMPSVYPPHPRLRTVNCIRILNLYVCGIPMWIYRWNMQNGDVREKGIFGIIRPDRVFGMYDTAAIPDDDGGIVDALGTTMEGMKRGSKAKQEGTKIITFKRVNERESGDSNDEAARRIDEASERLDQAARYASRKWKK